METHEAAERASRWDGPLALARVIGEIVLWTLLGLFGIGLSFHTHDVALGRVYWLVGCIVWLGGFSVAVLSAYRRGEERGEW